MAGYKAFGSFFSDGVEDLLAHRELRTRRPSWTSQTARHVELEDGGGRQLFPLDRHWAFLNHGAFGLAAKPFVEEAQRWRERCEQQPLRFMDRELFSFWIDSLEAVAQFIEARAENVVLVPNVSFAVWSVLASLFQRRRRYKEEQRVPHSAEHQEQRVPQSGEHEEQRVPHSEANPEEHEDVVVVLDLTYGATKKMLGCLQVRVAQVEIPMPPPLEESEWVRLVVEEVRKNIGAVRLVVLDHITSATSLIIPVVPIAAAVKELGIPVLVDGAHAPGTIELDLGDNCPFDFYTGNFHKWMCAPRGAAFLWISDNFQKDIDPAVVSHGICEPDLQSRFLWIGNMDYAPLLSLVSVIQFWKTVNLERVWEYQRNLRKQVIDAFWNEFGEDNAKLLVPQNSQLLPQNMFLIAVPESITRIPRISNSAKALQDALYLLSIEVPVKNIKGKLYFRISIHMYNTFSDYQHLIDALKRQLT